MPASSVVVARARDEDDNIRAGVTLTPELVDIRQRGPKGRSVPYRRPALTNKAVPEDVHAQLGMAGLQPLTDEEFARLKEGLIG